jgi:glycosyltransferase involved in cell wall biosynthesis
MPTVSVIIPAFNSALFVEDAIRSVLAQTMQNFEIVIVDDGSTDNTADVVKALASERVRYICKTNQGPSAARNVGIRHALGEYVAFLDSDDRWLPRKLEAQLDRFKERPESGLIHCTAKIEDFNGNVQRQQNATLEGHALDTLLMGNQIVTSSVMVPKYIFDNARKFDESISRGEDWDLWMNISAAFPIASVIEPLTIYTLVPGSLMKNTNLFRADSLKVLEKAFTSYAAHRTHLRQKAIAQVHFGAGVCFGTSGNCSESRKALIHALRLDPFIMGVYWRLLLTILGSKVNRALRQIKNLIFRGLNK